MSSEGFTREEVEAARVAGMRSLAITDFVPAVSPQFTRPSHQRKLIKLIRRAHRAARRECEPVFACVSLPPQTAKTETVLHGIAWWLLRNPEDYLAYITYGQDLASKKSRRVRDLVRRVGVTLRDDATRVDEWHTAQDGGLLARGWEGGITGQEALAALFLDDLYKNRSQAESSAHRDKVDDAVRDVVITRLQPWTSVINFATRWHEDDQTGRLVKRGWEQVNEPAISDGVPFWEESGRDLSFYERVRAQVGEYTWASLYMGDPRPRSGKLFRDVHVYGAPPNSGTFAIGVDLAYSSKASADYSVAVVMQRVDHRCYIVDVVRRQCAAPDFAATLKRLQERYRHAPIAWYAGGTEKGVADFLVREGVRLRVMPAVGDKYTRAQSTSAAWNRGEIMVPGADADGEDPEWLDAFVDEVTEFSGIGDRHDDQVDALVAAYDTVGVPYHSGPIYVTPKTAPTNPWGSSGPKGPWG